MRPSYNLIRPASRLRRISPRCRASRNRRSLRRNIPGSHRHHTDRSIMDERRPFHFRWKVIACTGVPTYRKRPGVVMTWPGARSRRCCGPPAIRTPLPSRYSFRAASPYAVRHRFRPQLTSKGKGKEVTYSLPLSTYSALGALRQDPGRAAESPAEARTCGNRGFAKYGSSCRRVGFAVPRTGGTCGAVAGSRCGGAGMRAAGLRGATGRNTTLLNGDS